MKLNIFASLVALGTHAVYSCDLCSVYSAAEPTVETGRGLFAGVAEQFTCFNSYQIDGHQVANIGDQYLASSISQAFVGYDFSHRIGLQLNLPVIYREYGYLGRHGSDLGIGDISLVANVRLYEKSTENFTFSWSALGGVKFPTGSAAHLDPAVPDFAPGIGGHDLTLGSGSFDGLIGTGFYAAWKRIFLSGTMQYAIRTEGEFGYQFANDWIWSGGPGVYLVLKRNHALALQAIVSGESKAEDTIQGAATDDTAITAVYLGPQLTYTWASKMSVQLGLDLPVSLVTTGQQIVPDYRVRAAFTWRF